MACGTTTGTRLEKWRILIDFCGKTSKFCCFNDLLINTEVDISEAEYSHSGCEIKPETKKRTGTATVTLFNFEDEESLSALFDDGTFTEVAAAPVIGATMTLNTAEWGYSVDELAYQIENQNGDQSIIAVSGVVWSVDGALVAGTDYNVIEREICLDNGDKYTISYIELVTGGAITTNEQELVVTYDYTPIAEKLFKIPMGDVVSNTADLTIIARDISTGDTRVIKLEGVTINPSGNLISLSDTAETPEGLSVEMNISEVGSITMWGLKNTSCQPCV